MPILMVMFSSSIFDRNHPFWATLVQKIKIVSLSWNLVLRLIQICRTQLWCSLFLFYNENTLFRQIWSKASKFLVSAEVWYLEYFEYVEFNGGVPFFCFRLEIPFLGKFGPKTQNCQFKLKILCLDLLKHAEFNGDVRFFLFGIRNIIFG